MWKQLYLLALLTLSFVISGCSQALDFETIELSSRSRWDSLDPGLLIITNREEAAEADQFIRDEGQAALSQVDFNTHLAIIALRGWQPSSKREVEVEAIIYQNNEVNLYAQPIREDINEIITLDVITSPYHLIKIQKPSDWNGEIAFNLYFDKDEPPVVSATHLFQ